MLPEVRLESITLRDAWTWHTVSRPNPDMPPMSTDMDRQTLRRQRRGG